MKLKEKFQRIDDNVNHISFQNDVIISTLVKILEAIDSKEIQAIKIRLEEQIIQN